MTKASLLFNYHAWRMASYAKRLPDGDPLKIAIMKVKEETNKRLARERENEQSEEIDT